MRGREYARSILPAPYPLTPAQKTILAELREAFALRFIMPINGWMNSRTGSRSANALAKGCARDRGDRRRRADRDGPA